MTNTLDRVIITRRRPAYKGEARLYRTLFYGCLCFCGLLMALLAWALKGNYALQTENAAMREFIDRDITAEIR